MNIFFKFDYRNCGTIITGLNMNNCYLPTAAAATFIYKQNVQLGIFYFF